MLPKSKGPAVGSDEGLQTKTISKKTNRKIRIRRQRFSAWTHLLDAIADWHHRLSERLDGVDALDVEEEVRIFRDVCRALSDFLAARQAA